MGYSGMVSSEHSTGDSVRRGAITKTGNAHLRRIAAKRHGPTRYRPGDVTGLKKRQEGLSEEVKEIAWKAQHRLCTRYRRLVAKGKLRQKVTTAIGRELLGFIWAIGMQVEKEQRASAKTAPRGLAHASTPEDERSEGVSSWSGASVGRGAHGKEDPRRFYVAGFGPDPRR